jgi:hypothetical protein
MPSTRGAQAFPSKTIKNLRCGGTPNAGEGECALKYFVGTALGLAIHGR